MLELRYDKVLALGFAADFELSSLPDSGKVKLAACLVLGRCVAV